MAMIITEAELVPVDWVRGCLEYATSSVRSPGTLVVEKKRQILLKSQTSFGSCWPFWNYSSLSCKSTTTSSLVSSRHRIFYNEHYILCSSSPSSSLINFLAVSQQHTRTIINRTINSFKPEPSRKSHKLASTFTHLLRQPSVPTHHFLTVRLVIFCWSRNQSWNWHLSRCIEALADPAAHAQTIQHLVWRRRSL